MMPSRELRGNQAGRDSAEEWVRVPAVIDKNGDKVITLYDGEGRPRTRGVAELILETFAGPRPPGHEIHFKDGNRLNCEMSNLAWMPVRENTSEPSDANPNEEAVARALATRSRADQIRRSLAGREHSDSAELIAEDRLR